MNILVHGYGVLTTQDEQQIPIPYAAGTNDFLAIIYNPPTAIYEPNTIRCAGSSNYASKGVFFVFEYTKITDLSDIIWWSPKMTANNVPAPFAASASSALTDNTSAWNAFDNNANTYWHSTSTDSNPWIMFDFGQRTYTRGVRLTARTYNGTPQIFPYHGTVEGSNDGEHWVEIKSFSDLAKLDNGRTEEVLFSNPAVFRYYRISNMGAGYVGFAELEFLVRI